MENIVELEFNGVKFRKDQYGDWYYFSEAMFCFETDQWCLVTDIGFGSQWFLDAIAEN